MTTKRLAEIYCIGGIGVVLIGFFCIFYMPEYRENPDFASLLVLGFAAGLMTTIQGAGRLLGLDKGDEFQGRPVIRSLVAAGALSILATLFVKFFFLVDVFEIFVTIYSPIMFGGLALLNFVLSLLLDHSQTQ